MKTYFVQIEYDTNVDIYPFKIPISNEIIQKTLKKKFDLEGGTFFIVDGTEEFPLNPRTLMFCVNQVLNKKSDKIIVRYKSRKRKREHNDFGIRKKMKMFCKCKSGCKSKRCSCNKNNSKCGNSCECENCKNLE